MTRRATRLAILLLLWVGLLGTALVLLDEPADSATAPLCFGKPATMIVSGVELFRGTTGPDVIVAFDGAEVEGLAGDDRICGAARAFGGPGDDRIGYSGPARRVLDLWGGPGDDLLRLRSAAFGDMVGGRGDDVIMGARGSQSLGGGPGRDRLLARRGADELHGGHGADLLRGGHGADQLRGGHGADELRGGSGVDTGRGGAGVDRCFAVETILC